MCFLHLDFVCIFCFTAIFHYAFNAVWRWNIKYLSNPWTTSLSLFSLVWVSKTHMLTGGLLTKHFQGRRRGWYMSVKKKKYIHLCMSAPPWHNGDFQKKTARSVKQSAKARAGFTQEMLASLHPWEVWGGPVWFPLLSCLYLPLRSGASKPLQFHRHKLFMLALINSLCICNGTHTLIEIWSRSPTAVQHMISGYDSLRSD